MRCRTSPGGGTRPARSTTAAFASSPTRCSALGWGTCAGDGAAARRQGPLRRIWPSCRICTPTISTSGRIPFWRHVPVAVPGGALRAVPGLRRLRDRELVEVVPGDTVRVGHVVVEVVPAEHDGHRWPWSRRRAPALGYVVSGKARTYFAGDTDWSPVVREAVGRCDIALLPVGGWAAGWDPDTSTRRAPPASWPSSTPTTPFRCTSARCGRSAWTGPPGSLQPPRNGVRRARRPVASPLHGAGAAARGDGAARMCPIARRGEREPGSGRPRRMSTLSRRAQPDDMSGSCGLHPLQPEAAAAGRRYPAPRPTQRGDDWDARASARPGQ